MKLAVDTHHLFLENAGTRRVTVNLLKQLRKMPDVDLVELKPPYPLFKGTGILGKIFAHCVRFIWVHIHLPLQCIFYKADVLLSPEFNTPMYTHCKRAVIVHDAHMRAQKEFISSLWFYCYYIPFIEWPIRNADLIFTVSHFAKKQIVELMRLDARKVHVVYNGIDNNFTDQEGSLDHIERPDQKEIFLNEYILFVGTFEARKNIERLIEAFSVFKKKYIAKAETMKLVIVGKPGTGMFSDRSKKIEALINRLDLKDEIILCGYLQDGHLQDLYRKASIIAFPSLHEGFGLPIIEGFASGVPVLTSNVCSMPEIAGRAALLVDPYNVSDIAEKIALLIFDLPLREKLIRDGKERVKDFTWERSVKQMMSEILALLA